jgi:hypothetical protein
MVNFTLSYEDAKKLLHVFYHSPYQVAASYVDMLHALEEIGSSLTLKDHVDAEAQLLNAVNNKEA